MEMLRDTKAGDVRLFVPDTGDLGVRAVFTARLGGVSEPPFDTLNLSSMVGDEDAAVDENRRLVERSGGFQEGSIALLKQVHGSDVVEAGQGTCGVVGEGDVLVTRERGVTVGVLTADCVPVLMAGPDGVTAAHAGWRGLVAGAIEHASGSVGGARAAWVGPSIHACCYEVGPEVVAAFRDASLPVADENHVDPGRAALAVLRRLGIERVGYTDVCTSCDPELFSFRRDGPETGRQGGFIAWT